jgi:hypothetical protein
MTASRRPNRLDLDKPGDLHHPADRAHVTTSTQRRCGQLRAPGQKVTGQLQGTGQRGEVRDPAVRIPEYFYRASHRGTSPFQGISSDPARSLCRAGPSVGAEEHLLCDEIRFLLGG